MEEEINLEDAGIKSGIKKIGELFSGESKLIRTILISALTVIIICVLLYFNYILIGQFFPTIFLAFIASLALRSTKEFFSGVIIKYFNGNKFFIRKSSFLRIFHYVHRGFNYLYQYLRYVLLKDPAFLLESKRSRQISIYSHCDSVNFTTEEDEHTEEEMTMFNNIKYLFLVCIFYVVVFKFEIFFSITLIVCYIIIEFTLRLIFDAVFSFVKFTDRRFFLKKLIFNGIHSDELNDTVHSLLSLLIIFGFSLMILFTVMLAVWLIFIDFKSIVTYIQANNNYVNYLNSVLPQNIKDYYNYENFGTFYNSNIFVHMKTFESFINSTIEDKLGKTDIRGNYTLYDISQSVVHFLKDPSLIIETFHSLNQDEKKSTSDTNAHLISFIEDKCAIYSNEIISQILHFVGVDYASKLYCGARMIIERFNMEFSVSIFSKNLRRVYLFLLEVFKFLAGTIFLNFLSLSMEIINSIMLGILFITCLFNFLKTKGDYIRNLLKFLPYPEKEIRIIDTSFHKSIRGVFISTGEIFIYHAILTWIIFDMCNIKFVFILSMLAGIFTLIPIITPWLILLPGNLLIMVDGEFSIMKIIALNISYYIIICAVDNDIYQKNLKRIDPYFTGLSFVLGMYAFGFKGLIYGPVLLCVTITVIDIIHILISPNCSQKGGGTTL